MGRKNMYPLRDLGLGVKNMLHCLFACWEISIFANPSTVECSVLRNYFQLSCSTTQKTVPRWVLV